MRTIYYHGTIITMDEEHAEAEAVCIEDETIIAVGSKGEMQCYVDETSVWVDLQGHTMLPGFIDGHSHFVGLANSLSLADLSEAKSFADIKRILMEFKEKNHIKDGEWIVGKGYDHNFMMEKEHPDRFLLDEVSMKSPILISHVSSHMGVANTMALEVVGVDAHTVDPDGGKFLRIKDSEEPNGYMEENAFLWFQKALPMMRADRMLELIKEAQDIYASYGITTVQDGMIIPSLFTLLQYAAKSHTLALDVVGYVDLKDAHDLCKQHPEYVKQYQNHFKIGGYKIFLDGSPQGRTAWMTTPYIGKEEYYGYPIRNDEQVYELIKTAVDEEMQLLAHCNGDAAAEQYISQFEKVMEQGVEETCRPVMIHAQLVREDQLACMVPLHMAPSFFIDHTYFWGDIHIKNFGKERADHISPAKTATILGLPYTFHQDSPVIMPDMMRTVSSAVNRKTKNGVSLGREQCISVYDALKAITLHGAYQYFEEDSKGTICKGKKADLVILDNNPLMVAPAKIADIQVLETIKSGRPIFKR